jgi:choline dehydrogenase-like flavoprotein
MLQPTEAIARAIRSTTLEAIRAPGKIDAIVVGAGAAGGLAAALLTEAGLRVLVLDAGWRVKFWQAPLRRIQSAAFSFLSDARLLQRLPPALVWKSQRLLQLMGSRRQPVQSECYAWPSAPDTFVDDRDWPYEAESGTPYNWIRVHCLGGRMIVPLHGRQYYRHGPADWYPSDGRSPAWPFAAEDLDRWYDLVETRLTLSGGRDGSRWIPNSRLAAIRDPSPAEAEFISRIKAAYPAAEIVLGRYAPPYNSLQAAAETGRLLCRQGAVARHIDIDPEGRATGVVFHDRANGSLEHARAPLIFVCASTLESTRILLTSTSEHLPNGPGGASGALGRHLMDHVSIKVEGVGPALPRSDRPSAQGDCIYLPRFDLSRGIESGTGRGFGVRVYLSPGGQERSYFVAVADSEMLPRAENVVTLSPRRDVIGFPTLRIRCSHSADEMAVAELQRKALIEIAALAGAHLNSVPEGAAVPGSSIHEVGTARMGSEPENSVLDPFNECWDARGLFVTDGASLPSIGLQNPTLTIMALTARAVDRAVGSRA